MMAHDWSVAWILAVLPYGGKRHKDVGGGENKMLFHDSNVSQSVAHELLLVEYERISE